MSDQKAKRLIIPGSAVQPLTTDASVNCSRTPVCETSTLSALHSRTATNNRPKKGAPYLRCPDMTLPGNRFT